ncbi:MAG: HU family DNA-binding protein, partial [Alphaproteobacteria bacterium]
MNKNELVAAVADSADLSKADAAKAVDAVFD